MQNDRAITFDDAGNAVTDTGFRLGRVIISSGKREYFFQGEGADIYADSLAGLRFELSARYSVPERNITGLT